MPCAMHALSQKITYFSDLHVHVHVPVTIAQRTRMYMYMYINSYVLMFLVTCVLLLSLIYSREKQRSGAEIFSPLLSFSGLAWRLKVYPVR